MDENEKLRRDSKRDEDDLRLLKGESVLDDLALLERLQKELNKTERFRKGIINELKQAQKEFRELYGDSGEGEDVTIPVNFKFQKIQSE